MPPNRNSIGIGAPAGARGVIGSSSCTSLVGRARSARRCSGTRLSDVGWCGDRSLDRRGFRRPAGSGCACVGDGQVPEVMGLHPITAGHGYTYLTSQTAAQDSSLVTAGGLGSYYSERGESPGRWVGSGLASLTVAPGSMVREDQMVALFGEGRHPDAAVTEAALVAEGQDADVVAAVTELGRPFALNVASGEFRRQVARLVGEWNVAHGEPQRAQVPVGVMARIRTIVGQAMFEEDHGRPAADAQELSGFVARVFAGRVEGGGRVRSDVLAGEKCVGVVGARTAGGGAGDRAGASGRDQRHD